MKFHKLLPVLLIFRSIIVFGQQVGDSAKLLDPVEVSAKKRLYEQKPEGIIVNVQSSLMSKASSVLELLERAPGVMIDRQNGGIIFKGKADVLVLLNGRPMRLSPQQIVALLNGMSGSDVSRIELLDAPPAGYDANGTAGVINIVTSKIRSPGTSGTLTVTGGIGWADKTSASFRLAHNAGKLRMYGNYSFFHDRSYSEMFITSQQNMPVYGGDLSVVVHDTTRHVQQNHDALLGADVQFGKINVGYSLNWSRVTGFSNNITRSDFLLFPDSLLFFRGLISARSIWNNFLHELYAEKQIREGEKFTISVNYLRFNNANPSDVTSVFHNSDGEPVKNTSGSFAPRQRGSASTLIEIGVAELKHEKRFGKKWTWQGGMKLTNTKTLSGSGIESLIDDEWVSRGETINNATMRETIGGLHGSVSLKSDSVTSITAGVRYEYWTTNLIDPVSKQKLRRLQGSLFPNISLTRKLDLRNELQFSFSSRVSRPLYTDLASFVRYSDPTAIYTGNTSLRSGRSYQLKVALNHRRYNFSLSMGHEKDPIARYQIAESPDRTLLLVAPQNLDYQNHVSLQANLPLTVNSWWTMNYNFSADTRQIKLAHTSIPLRKTYFTYSANFIESFSLPHKFSAELSGWYNARSYNGSIRVAGMGSVNVAAKKQFNNNHGSLQLSVADVFSTVQINTYYGSLVPEAFQIRNHVRIDTESAKAPIFKLSYTRLLGKQTVSSRTKSMEEKERVQF